MSIMSWRASSTKKAVCQRDAVKPSKRWDILTMVEPEYSIAESKIYVSMATRSYQTTGLLRHSLPGHQEAPPEEMARRSPLHTLLLWIQIQLFTFYNHIGIANNRLCIYCIKVTQRLASYVLNCYELVEGIGCLRC